LEDLNIVEAVEKIKWPAWTKVKLKILRPWEKEILEKEVVRNKIKIPTVETKTFSWAYENIGYISLNMFWEESSKEFKNALEKMKNKDWIIIDLRDNWGWYLNWAVEIISNFIENWKKVVEVKWKTIFDNSVYNSAWLDDKYKWKIVILINWNSASASEITAWALRDYNKAILVWEKSYWKWSVQTTKLFSDWSELKYTIAKWFTPKWKNIDWIWIEPDIEVKFEKQDYDLEACKKAWVCNKNMKEEDFKFFDRQLDIAKKVLEDFIKNWNIDKVIEKWNKNNK
jgi:carboxyl-terminal processing protease